MAELEFCTFTWRDQDGEHRCDDFRPHVEHRCCCGNTMNAGEQHAHDPDGTP